MRTFELPSRGDDLTSLSVALVAFEEVFLSQMVEAYHFARWLTGNADDAGPDAGNFSSLFWETEGNHRSS